MNLSYPNLQFLSHLVAFDVTVQHEASIASSVAEISIPYVFLDYIQLKGSASIKVMSARGRFVTKALLQTEWCKMVKKFKQAVPVVVAIACGASGAIQFLTGTVHLLRTRYTDPTVDTVDMSGVRWLHCEEHGIPEKIESQPVPGTLPSDITGQLKRGGGHDKEPFSRADNVTWFANLPKRSIVLMRQLLDTNEGGALEGQPMRWDKFLQVSQYQWLSQPIAKIHSSFATRS